MCRHLAYVGPELRLSDLLTTQPRSLYEQSWAPRLQRHGVVNADGFGIGWYPAHGDSDSIGNSHSASHGNREPARYRRAVPIWADPNLPDLLRSIRSSAVIAAVRSATPLTSQDESAAAPFRSGKWLFSHNGSVPDWTTLPVGDLAAEDLLTMEARCDSALLWALLSRRLQAGEPADEAMKAVIALVVGARPTARLNLLLADGHTITATRHGDTLWYRTGAGAVLVASEPCDDPDGPDAWTEVPDGSILIATRTEITVETEEVAIPKAPLAGPVAGLSERNHTS